MNEPQLRDKQPELHVLNSRTMTFEQMMDLFRRLTGREPTAQEIEEARRDWEKQESE